MYIKKSQIIITADDAFAFDSIDDAIIQLVRKGVITKIAAFTTYGKEKKILNSIPSDFPVGIHFNISSGKPLSNIEKIPTLIDKNGNFISPMTFSKEGIEKQIENYIKNHIDQINLTEVYRELFEQLSLFNLEFNRDIAFNSIHHDLDKNKRMKKVLNKILPKMPSRQTKITNSSLSGFFYIFLKPDDSFDSAKKKIIKMIYKGIERSNNLGGVPCELICHPCKNPYELDDFTLYRKQRKLELDVWMSPEIRDFFFNNSEKKGHIWSFNNIQIDILEES